MDSNNINFDLIESKICDFFSVSREDLLSKSKKKTHKTARHYLWFVLHCRYGVSNGDIAKRYGCSKRPVIRYISLMKFLVTNQREDIERYEALKKIL